MEPLAQDYLFTPLAWADTGAAFGGRLPAELCIFIVFFVSGLWHGSTLPFVVWGLWQAACRLGEEALHRRFGKPKKHAPARIVWGKRAAVFALWCLGMVFFRVGSGAFGYLAACFTGWDPARFAAEAYGAVYAAFYPHPLMVAGYYAFLLAVLALAIWFDARRALVYKNKPAEDCLAAEPHRTAVYYLLVVFLLVGYILQNGGFGGAAGFGLYAGF